MIETQEQFERAEEAIVNLKRFLLAARGTHGPDAYAALSAPILRELQERERDEPSARSGRRQYRRGAASSSLSPGGQGSEASGVRASHARSVSPPHAALDGQHHDGHEGVRSSPRSAVPEALHRAAREIPIADAGAHYIAAAGRSKA
jgi:hypothetical protein